MRTVTAPVIEKMAKECASKIKELNGGKSVNAVFVVGGGGKMRGYTDKVAACLGIAKERVAVRGEEVLTTVDFGDTGFMKDSLYVTPVGICTNYYTQKNSFVFVNVNNERIKMYDNNHLTVVDAVMQIGFPNDKLFPRRGEELEFTVNGKSRLVRGTPGEGAEVFLNGKRANLNSRIEQNDVIEVHESTAGEPAHITIGQLEEYNSTITFIVNDKKVILSNEDVKKVIEEVSTSLGYKGRLLVRESGTEPVIRVMVEAESQEVCNNYANKVVEVIKQNN